jgi:regulator of protease activity HflC (stomatin/prohibitin superfamily)
LSKETIAAVREAEQTAERIRAEAAKRSAEMVANEKRAGEELLERAEAECSAEIADRFRELDEATEKLVEKNMAEAQMEARDIKNHAKLRMRGAINEIFRGLDRQCL